MRRSDFKRILYVHKVIYYRIWYLNNKRKFKNLGKGSVIKSPLAINGSSNIEIGKNVFIGYKTWLAAVPHTGATECLLKFEDGCIIGNFNHIYSTKKIAFGKKVLTADKVYISDNLHGYENIDAAVMDQPIRQINEVYIGDGTWIGENVCILGASIGKNCVIGANAVVTKNIPDYSIAVGNPAKIIKRYCFDSKKWEKTSPDGNFLMQQ
ncbi:MAG TPA: DapH/DapD/GlmU-related protein [Chitinophagaceae bacterium]|nr:DapH/DapD/GlmU-related protein [Chitinophagaceae bacterium]